MSRNFRQICLDDVSQITTFMTNMCSFRTRAEPLIIGLSREGRPGGKRGKKTKMSNVANPHKSLPKLAVTPYGRMLEDHPIPRLMLTTFKEYCKTTPMDST